MFCLPGMTAYRALFDVLGIPYVGNPPDVMALRRRQGAGPGGRRRRPACGVPAGEVLRPRRAARRCAPPAVVKPVDADNSLGRPLVRDAGGVRRPRWPARSRTPTGCWSSATSSSGARCAAASSERDGELVCLPLEEYAVDPASKPIRDHDDKISRDGDGDLGLVAKDAAHAWIVDPADPVTERGVGGGAGLPPSPWAAATTACSTSASTRTGEPWFLEAGLYCSFARKSVIPMMAAAAGIGLADLFATVVAAATLTGQGLRVEWG